ncbi:hypothetical protein DF105_21620 [Burkholderia stagnalis]|nr:hypothetical protein DF164_20950 [Burkholderia stagnalis]RQY11417.1 hypothetical protein DF118_16565 [Burkholderia stagnalis]RQY20075.1 hypothetical protein DF117_18745 [Burkholderia stagnalis]RQY40425.1 hypothetical protein DF113_17210 [Burkholderia stagnalis]RQY95979.1 hypothetical protein DF106_17790 [Burkholderia stagnalis]
MTSAGNPATRQHRAPGTGHRAPGTGHRASGIGHRAPGTGHCACRRSTIPPGRGGRAAATRICRRPCCAADACRRG